MVRCRRGAGQPRHDSLWQRFAYALGTRRPKGSTTPAPQGERVARCGLRGGAKPPSTSACRDLEFPEYAPTVQYRLAKGVLAGRRDLEPALGFDVPELAARAVRR